MIVRYINYYNLQRGQCNIRKLLSIAIIGIFLINLIGVSAIKNENEILENKLINYEKNEYIGRDFSHTILGEFTTYTWCTPCKRAHAALKNIYANGWFPFYYISLVWDKNKKADIRGNTELGATVYPTVFFDGGFKKNMGASSAAGAQAAYNISINECGNRTVNDIDLSLDVNWLGPGNPVPENFATNVPLDFCLNWTNAEMNIDVTVDNNEDGSYDGHIHIYVTEVVSSMGWIDSAGKPYTFPFLDYAFNEDISISAGGTWQSDIDWDGYAHDNGYGLNYAGITQDNIMLIAAVFDDSNNYVDETIGILAGTNTDPKTYDIYFGESNPPPKVSSNQSIIQYCPNNLDFSTTYFWKIVAWDNQGNSISGPVWSFTTRSEQNNPPKKPDIEGPSNGNVKIEYDYFFTSVDPDGDDLQFIINWGDGSKLEWTDYVSSGPPGLSECHSWYSVGTYTIKAKARDINGAESDWGELIVVMPKTKTIVPALLINFLKQNPNMFPILRLILQKLIL